MKKHYFGHSQWRIVLVNGGQQTNQWRLRLLHTCAGAFSYYGAMISSITCAVKAIYQNSISYVQLRHIYNNIERNMVVLTSNSILKF